MSSDNSAGPHGTVGSTGLSPKGAKTAAVIIFLFGLILVAFGQNLIGHESDNKAIAQKLQSKGETGVVDDVRIFVGRDMENQFVNQEIELTFTGSDGSSHALTTYHYRGFPADISVKGWNADFAYKDKFIGQDVRYLLGDKPVVELVSELPDLADAPRGFVSYLGFALAAMGAAALIGGAVFFLRVRRGTRT